MKDGSAVSFCDEEWLSGGAPTIIAGLGTNARTCSVGKFNTTLM
jgi:hypothetical protein